MTPEEKEFALELLNDCPNHQQWLTAMRYGLDQLLKEPRFLIERVVDEADRQLVRDGTEGDDYTRNRGGEVASILEELRLRVAALGT